MKPSSHPPQSKTHEEDMLSLVEHCVKTNKMPDQEKWSTLIEIAKEAVIENNKELSFHAICSLEKLNHRPTTRALQNPLTDLLISSLCYNKYDVKDLLIEKFPNAFSVFSSYVLTKYYFSLAFVAKDKGRLHPSIVDDVSFIISLGDARSPPQDPLHDSLVKVLLSDLSTPQLEQLYEKEQGRKWNVDFSSKLVELCISEPLKYDFLQKHNLIPKELWLQYNSAMLSQSISCFYTWRHLEEKECLSFIKKIKPFYPAREIVEICVSHIKDYEDQPNKKHVLDWLCEEDDIFKKEVLSLLHKKLLQKKYKKAFPFLASSYEKSVLLKKVKKHVKQPDIQSTKRKL